MIKNPRHEMPGISNGKENGYFLAAMEACAQASAWSLALQRTSPFTNMMMQEFS